jgi:phage tail-like protein
VRAGPYLFTLERIIEVGVPEAPPAVSEPAPAAPAEHITTPPEAPPPPPPPEFAEKVTSEKPQAAPPEPEQKPPEPLREVPRREEPPRIEREERVSPSAFIPRTDGDGDALGRIESIPPYGTLPPLETNGHLTYPFGVPTDVSNWLKYLPAIYSEDDFMGRYLLIFESILSPITWIVDNFDMFLSPEVAPSEWLRWLASWFDVLIVPELPMDRQRALVEQLGWLFFRRGTRAGLERLLTLYYGVKPEIIEDGDMHFTVRMPLSESSVKLERDIVDRLILAHKPAHAAYTLEIS